MTSSPWSAVRDPQQCITGLDEVIRHLAEYGISVVYAALPVDELVYYDEDAAHLELRDSAPLYQQLFALRQIWLLETFGPWMAPAVRKQRHLALVPQPRTAS